MSHLRQCLCSKWEELILSPLATDLKFHFQDSGLCNDCRLSFIHSLVVVCEGVEDLHFSDCPTVVGFVDVNVLDVDWFRVVQLYVCVCV